ncbi:MAG: 16S rRNA (cytosine(967)-C(5))-methyltransferase RsmB, partial [Nitrospirota bacterium]
LYIISRVPPERAEILLNQVFRTYSLDSRDRRLVTELVYGVLRNLISLDYSLSFYIKEPKKVQPEIRNILRLAAYQILYLDKIPARAAVDEAVEQTKKLSGRASSRPANVRSRSTGLSEASRLAGFVNAVLRSLLRKPEKVRFPDPDSEPADYLSLKLSYPKWLVERWTGRLGFDGAKALMEAGNGRPPLVLRATPTRRFAPPSLPGVEGDSVIYRDALAELFKKDGLETEAGKYAPDALIVKSHRPVPELPGYDEGLFSVQDEAAQLVSLLVDPKPGELVLDACAAPGGKSAHLSSIGGRSSGSGHGAHIVSIDISLDKLKLLKENSLRLKVENIFPVAADAAGALPFNAKFDRVLLDAPCSALGIIRRRPEIKYARKPADIARMAHLQLSMLENISGLLKPGGSLVYSVCSTEPEEGEGVVGKFLSRHPEFAPCDPRPLLPEAARSLAIDNFIRTFPHLHGTDGFFMARMVSR